MTASSTETCSNQFNGRMRLMEVVVIIEVEASVEEITAVMVETLAINPIMQRGGHQFNFL